MKNIIILGANGFIGKYLAQEFEKNKNLKIHGFSSKDCDLTKKEEVLEKLSFVTKEDTIIFASSITRQREDSINSMNKNVSMAENIIALMREKKIGNLIFISTVEVYGKVDDVVDEETVQNPMNYYSTSKLTSENILHLACSELEVPLSILRLPGIYGPGDDGISLISKIMATAKKKQFNIISDDERDYVYVGDVFKICDNLVKCPHNTLLNVATGESLKISQILKKLRPYLPKGYKVNNEDNSGGFDLEFDTTKLETLFPDLEMTSLSEGLKKYLTKENKTKKKK